MPKKRPVDIKDLFSLVSISEPQISPDGEKVAFVRTTNNYQKNDYLSDIWIYDVISRKLNQFTFGRGKDRNPRWSPDGRRMLFISTPPSNQGANEKPQVYIIQADGGEAQKITDLKLGVEAPKWGLDGNKILFISPIQSQNTKSDVKHITKLNYKYNARGFFPGVSKHVFSIPAKGGKPKQLTKGDYDVTNAEWIGSSILFIGNMRPDAEKEGYSYIHRLEGSEPRQLLDGTWHISSIAPSPDGKNIAFAGHDERRGGATKSDIWLLSIEGGSPKKLTGEFKPDLGVKISCDIRVSSPDSSPLWHNDGHIYFTSNFCGVSHLNRIDAEGGTVETLLGQVDHSVEAWSISEEGKIAYTNLATTSPGELWIRSEGNDKQLTDLNKNWSNNLDLRSHDRFVFTSSGGHEVEGWIMKPVGFKKNKKYPLLVEIHGGPRGVFGNALMHEHQLLAGKGWGVMYINPWGSGGYTEEFQAGLPEHYGEQDYYDIMEAVEYCTTTYDWVDPNRIGCLGGSYGGFMTNWIITHTNRFKAAVTMRSISNWVSFFGTSDVGWTFGKLEMGGTPWDNEEKLMAKSPIRYVGACKTPTLIIHSEEDYRCPMEQGEQFYTALRYLGVPTEFIRFPGENHELSRSGKPRHREERLKHIVRWFEKYL